MKINGRLIRIARVEKRWTQEQLAEGLKCHVATVSRLEKGSGSVHVIHDAAKLLDLSIEDLLTLPDGSTICDCEHAQHIE